MKPVSPLGRQLNEMALTAAQKLMSRQTGFVHYCSQEEESSQQTIPLVENFCFVLALLRSKTVENISQAKDLLNRLLNFQNPMDHQFPVFLHEFPLGRDSFIGAQLLPLFYYMIDEFHLILGNELNKRLVTAARNLMQYSLKILDEKEASYAVTIKIAAAAKVWGCYLKDSNMEEKGSQLLEQMMKAGMQPAWLSPSTIADICIALQLIYFTLQDSPWISFWEHLSHTWHRPTCTYIGPGQKHYQKGDEPQPTLYDLFLGYFSQNFSRRALKELPYHIQAVFVRPTEELLPPLQYPFKKENDGYVYQDQKFAYSLLDKKFLKNPAYENAFHLLNIVWGDKEKVHTFVCQCGNFDSFQYAIENHQLELFFQLSPEVNYEDREKARELAFFFDIEPDVKITIQGEKATTIELSEECIIESPQIKLSLITSLVEGEGQFLGHLMKGNRPSQIQLKGVHRFNAYDWQLFFRTLRRKGACRFKTTLSIHAPLE